MRHLFKYILLITEIFRIPILVLCMITVFLCLYMLWSDRQEIKANNELERLLLVQQSKTDLDSWPDEFYKCFQEYYNPYSAHGSEEFSEIMSAFLINHWNKASKIFTFMKENPEFEEFVTRGLWGEDEDLNKIIFYSQDKCPKDSIEICAKLAQAASKRLKVNALRK